MAAGPPNKAEFIEQSGANDVSLLKEIRDFLGEMAKQGAKAFPVTMAQVPPAGFWGANQAAAVPPPMPGSAAAMHAAGAGQYGSPIGPQAPGSLLPYRAHDSFGAMPEGLMGSIGHGALGLAGQTALGAANYAAAKTPYGTTGTTAQLGLNLEMGALGSLASAAENIPILGAYGKKQFEGLEEAVYGPEQRARGRLSPTFERMAMAGINVSDKEIDEAFRFAIPMERRGVYMKQRMDRIGAAVNAENALAGALSQIGF